MTAPFGAVIWGDYEWSPPKIKLDSSYRPGKWTKPVEPIIYLQGYHLTDPKGLKEWFDQSGLRAYLVEYRGKVHGSFEDSDDRKISVESCRILRPLTEEEHAEHGVFLSGEHTVKEGWARAFGNAVVTARGNALVYAYDNAVVDAYDNARVTASDNARVEVYGTASVTAHATVTIIDYRTR